MRAVVVEKRGKRAAALGTDGVVYLIDAKGHAVGDAVEVGCARKKRWQKPLTWAACVAVLCGMATTGVYAAYEPYAYVSVEAAPSVEYSLNRFDQVLDVRAVDEASTDVAAALSEEVRPFTHIDEALDCTVDRFYKDGYLTGASDDFVLISVTAKGEHKAKGLKEHLGERMGEEHENGRETPPAEVVNASRTEWEQAREQGTTPGKARLAAQAYGTQDASHKVDEWRSAPAGALHRRAQGDPPAEQPGTDEKTTSEPIGSEVLCAAY